MTDKEFLILAKTMKAAYGSQNFLPDDGALRTWFKMLGDLDYRLAAAAVGKHISISRFPPTIADIREQAAALSAGEKKDWLEGWGMVQSMIHRYGWSRPREALQALRDFDQITADVVQSMGWQNLCESENQIADRANFRQCYEVKQARQAEFAKLPPSLQAMISGIADNLKLKGDTNEEISNI